MGAAQHETRGGSNSNREVLQLALPALGSLIAEPLFLLCDSALVGHLGTTPLAALSLATTVLSVIVGLMVFLAYGTTPAVARRLGAGDTRGAVQAGVNGTWLATVLGFVLAIAGWFASPYLVAVFGATVGVSEPATEYLRISMLGLPAMLIVYAATGLLRGVQDTRTPLVVAACGFALNAGLNALLIYGVHLGVRGSATGTVLAQWCMVAAYVVIVVRHTRRVEASLRPQLHGVLGLAGLGWWLLLRTASLQFAFSLASYGATRLGPDSLAAWQVIGVIYNTTAFALDALAIAAQALVGRDLGAGNIEGVREVLARCLRWGLWCGAGLGVLVLAASPWLGALFSNDASVRGILPLSLALLAISTPLGGYVFVLDGVLMGASDGRYLAVTGLVNLICFAPFVAVLAVFASPGWLPLAGLTAAFAFVYLGSRAVTLGRRARGSAWMVTGVVH